MGTGGAFDPPTHQAKLLNVVVENSVYMAFVSANSIMETVVINLSYCT